jgi:hypothetical protein
MTAPNERLIPAVIVELSKQLARVGHESCSLIARDGGALHLQVTPGFGPMFQPANDCST